MVESVGGCGRKDHRRGDKREAIKMGDVFLVKNSTRKRKRETNKATRTRNHQANAPTANNPDG